MSSQYPYPQQYQYGGQPPTYDPSQYQPQQPQQQAQAPALDQGAAAEQPKGTPPDAADQEFWDKAFTAALGGISGEVRLTSDDTINKAAACAEKAVEFRKAYIKGETQGQIAAKKDAEDKKKGEEAQKKQQEELKAQQQKTDEEAKKRQEQLKKNQDAQLAPPPEGLITTMVPPQCGPVSDWLAATQPKPQPQQPAA